jgi:anti-sigma factor RsiW
LHEREERYVVSHPDFAKLMEFWFGELAPEDEERMEEHLLDCAHCSEQLDELVELGAGVSSVFRSGALRAVISPAFLQKMKIAGMRLREYRVLPNGSVNCAVTGEEDAVVGRLQASLTGVARLDLAVLTEQGEVRSRLQDIPFDPVAGEVLFCPSAAKLKQLPAHTDVVRLIAVDDSGERPLADYTFVHMPG